MIDKQYAERLLDSLIQEARDSQDLLGDVLQKMWDKLLISCHAFDEGRSLLLSEKALACLVHKGIPKSAIQIDKERIFKTTVELQSLTYCIEKYGFGFSAWPCTGHRRSIWGLPSMRWIALSDEEFAEFMLEFDSLVEGVTKKVKEFIIEKKKEDMIKAIIEQTENYR